MVATISPAQHLHESLCVCVCVFTAPQGAVVSITATLPFSGEKAKRVREPV